MIPLYMPPFRTNPCSTYSLANTTTQLLQNSSDFQGQIADVSIYSHVLLTVTSDVSSVPRGVKVQFYADNAGSSIVQTHTYTYDPAKSFFQRIAIVAPYLKVSYFNGNNTQTVFSLRTLCVSGELVEDPQPVAIPETTLLDMLAPDNYSYTVKVEGDGSINKTPSDLYLSVGTTGGTMVQSRPYVRIRPGESYTVYCTCYRQVSDPSTQVYIGLFDDLKGVFFVFDFDSGLTGVGYQSDGNAPTVIYQLNWNIDALDGETSPVLDINIPTKYVIKLCFPDLLEFGVIMRGRYTPVHRTSCPNLGMLPLRAFLAGEASELRISQLYITGSAQRLLPLRQRGIMSPLVSLPTSDTPVLTIIGKNHTPILPRRINIIPVDAPVVFNIRLFRAITADFLVSSSFTDPETDANVSLDTNATGFQNMDNSVMLYTGVAMGPREIQIEHTELSVDVTEGMDYLVISAMSLNTPTVATFELVWDEA